VAEGNNQQAYPHYPSMLCWSETCSLPCFCSVCGAWSEGQLGLQLQHHRKSVASWLTMTSSQHGLTGWGSIVPLRISDLFALQTVY
jgi:hypothetical protein